MVPVTSLWMPIVLSAVFVFIVSSIVHMVLPFHRGDFKTMPKEDEVMNALRGFHIPPGDYMMPKPNSPADMRSPGFIEKMTKGPVAIMTFRQPQPPAMGSNLVQWFLFSVVVSLFSGYIAARAVGPGTSYLEVFRFVGTSAFLAYGIGQWPVSIWYSRSWATTIKGTFDGLLYALVTAGTFGWLWPKM